MSAASRCEIASYGERRETDWSAPRRRPFESDFVEAVDVQDDIKFGAQRQQVSHSYELLRLLVASQRQVDEHELFAGEPAVLGELCLETSSSR